MEAGPWWYHVTLASNLPSIYEDGLLPGHGGMFSGYGGHAAGKLFFCDADAVDCWWSKIRDLAEHHHEGRELVEEHAVPVLLRFEQAALDNDPLEDPLGMRDCIGGESFYTTASVDEAFVEAWDGAAWISLDVADPESVARAYVTRADEQWEEGEEDAWLDVELELPPGWEPLALKLLRPRKNR